MKSPFRFFDEEDLFKGFGLFPDDTTDTRSYIFHNDTSFFPGPDSAFMLPPGFFAPDMKGLEDLQQYFDKHFKSFSPDEFFNDPDKESPYGKFLDPKQREEWEKLIQKQQQEQEEFYKKWKNQKPAKKTEKM